MMTSSEFQHSETLCKTLSLLAHSPGQDHGLLLGLCAALSLGAVWPKHWVMVSGMLAPPRRPSAQLWDQGWMLYSDMMPSS